MECFCMCNHLNKSYWAVLFCGTVYYALQELGLGLWFLHEILRYAEYNYWNENKWSRIIYFFSFIACAQTYPISFSAPRKRKSDTFARKLPIDWLYSFWRTNTFFIVRLSTYGSFYKRKKNEELKYFILKKLIIFKSRSHNVVQQFGLFDSDHVLVYGAYLRTKMN